MTKDNIHLFEKPNSKTQSGPISLEGVILSMMEWREQKKKKNEKIPDALWDAIFALLEIVPERSVCFALGIGAEQIKNKRQEIRSAVVNTTELHSFDIEKNQDELKPVEFCEANPKFPLAYKSTKAFSTTTSVVELYRPDGMLMKIHISTERFEELLRAFAKV